MRIDSCQHCHGTGYHHTGRDGTGSAYLCECVRACEVCGGDDSPAGDGFRLVTLTSPDYGDYEAAVQCPACYGIRQILRRMRAAGDDTPPRHSGARFQDRPEQAAIRRTLQAWVAAWIPGTPGFTLVGPTGVGKSFLLTHLVGALRSKHRVIVRYEDVGSLVQRLQRGIASGGITAIIDDVETVEVLVLDDLPRQWGSTWASETIGGVLRVRYDHQRTTVIATNHDEAGLRELWGGGEWGERMLSRMAQMAPLTRVGGQDGRSMPTSPAWRGSAL